jgi:hypothetical protein
MEQISMPRYMTPHFICHNLSSKNPRTLVRYSPQVREAEGQACLTIAELPPCTFYETGLPNPWTFILPIDSLIGLAPICRLSPPRHEAYAACYPRLFRNSGTDKLPTILPRASHVRTILEEPSVDRYGSAHHNQGHVLMNRSCERHLRACGVLRLRVCHLDDLAVFGMIANAPRHGSGQACILAGFRSCIYLQLLCPHSVSV